MSRNGAGIATFPAGTDGAPNTVIESAKYNAMLADLLSMLNSAYPVALGGTGGTSTSTARDSLEIDSNVLSVNSDYTALVGDRSKLIVATSAITLSLTAAASLGNGWYVLVRATSGIVTINPNGSETINGELTLVLEEGQSVGVYCDGTDFHSVGVEDAISNRINKYPFTSDGLDPGGKVFTIGVTPLNQEQTIVAINGVVQEQTAYSLSGNVITLDTITPSGNVVEITSLAVRQVGVTSADLVTIDDLDNKIIGTDVESAFVELAPFDTVADMVASPSLLVGMRVSTLGYTTIGDGGANSYTIVAAATGTDDGGSYIDLATFQAQGLFPDGEGTVLQFGATATADDETAFINYARWIESTQSYYYKIPAKRYTFSLAAPIKLYPPKIGTTTEQHGAIFDCSGATFDTPNNVDVFALNGWFEDAWAAAQVGSGATATATVSGGNITGVTVATGGTGYTTLAVRFTGGGGVGGYGSVTIVAGVVTAVAVTSSGDGNYSTAPTVVFDKVVVSSGSPAGSDEYTVRDFRFIGGSFNGAKVVGSGSASAGAAIKAHFIRRLVMTPQNMTGYHIGVSVCGKDTHNHKDYSTYDCNYGVYIPLTDTHYPSSEAGNDLLNISFKNVQCSMDSTNVCGIYVGTRIIGLNTHGVSLTGAPTLAQMYLRDSYLYGSGYSEGIKLGLNLTDGTSSGIPHVEFDAVWNNGFYTTEISVELICSVASSRGILLSKNNGVSFRACNFLLGVVDPTDIIYMDDDSRNVVIDANCKFFGAPSGNAVYVALESSAARPYISVLKEGITPLSVPITLTGWSPNAVAATSNTLLDMSSIFSAFTNYLLPPKSYLVRVQSQLTVSSGYTAAGSTYVRLSKADTAGTASDNTINGGQMRMDSMYSSALKTNQMWVPANQNGDMWCDVVLSGTTTNQDVTLIILDVWV